MRRGAGRPCTSSLEGSSPSWSTSFRFVSSAGGAADYLSACRGFESPTSRHIAPIVYRLGQRVFDPLSSVRFRVGAPTAPKHADRVASLPSCAEWDSISPGCSNRGSCRAGRKAVLKTVALETVMVRFLHDPPQDAYTAKDAAAPVKRLFRLARLDT